MATIVRTSKRPKRGARRHTPAAANTASASVISSVNRAGALEQIDAWQPHEGDRRESIPTHRSRLPRRGANRECKRYKPEEGKELHTLLNDGFAAQRSSHAQGAEHDCDPAQVHRHLPPNPSGSLDATGDHPLAHERVFRRDEEPGKIGGVDGGRGRSGAREHVVVAGKRPDYRQRHGGARSRPKRQPHEPDSCPIVSPRIKKTSPGPRDANPLDEDEPSHEKHVRHGEHDGLIPRTERLENDDNPESREAAPVRERDVPLHRDQRQRNPEAPDHVQVSVALVHPVEAEGKRQPSDRRCDMVENTSPR